MSERDINEIKYSLCKHLNDDFDPMEIFTNYGNIPLSQHDIAAVRKLLRIRFESVLRNHEEVQQLMTPMISDTKKQPVKENKMSQSIKTIYTHITWHEITDPPGILPDAELEILIYDADKDDVLKGFLETSGDDINEWIDLETQLPLENPKFWAEVPFPNGPEARPGIL